MKGNLAVKEETMPKTLYSFRFDPELIKKVEKMAKKENRNLTNFIETHLLKLVEDNEKKKK